MTALDFAATDEALATGVVGRVLARDTVVVDGPDARTYLQGQVTQDLDPLPVGGATDALVLSPQGKIDAYVRIHATSPERFVVEVEAGYGEVVLERLRRFKIRIKATLELVPSTLVEVRGPLAVPPVDVPVGVSIAPYRFATLAGYDLVGTDASLPDGVPTGDDTAFEVARILAGVPAMGHELTEKTIPQEAAIVERTVSFTKGCYTGQELVARLDARGNRVPWNLASVRIPGEAKVAPDATLATEGREVGRITSSAYSPTLGATVALGYLRRDFEPPALVVVHAGASELPAEVIALPIQG